MTLLLFFQTSMLFADQRPGNLRQCPGSPRAGSGRCSSAGYDTRNVTCTPSGTGYWCDDDRRGYYICEDKTGACCTPTAWTPSLCPASCQQTRTEGCGGPTTRACTGGSCVTGEPVMAVRCSNGTVQRIAGVPSSDTAATTTDLRVRKNGNIYKVVIVPSAADSNASCARFRDKTGAVKVLRRCDGAGTDCTN